ncbi:unknown protein [Simkania negevensis Z]|uniref:Uncharacterized protein n=1 Tax=Simkania negevensis (strain ATCC VR-1471 / DSM 27360 / Z) TaxID=331113 RepID=F8L3P7_SIMNZ|nr:unknown protein [Simkania negevensis Z]
MQQDWFVPKDFEKLKVAFETTLLIIKMKPIFIKIRTRQGVAYGKKELRS